MELPSPASPMARSRQKNCNGCVVAKRRCDRRTPVCSRCTEKMIPCTWGKARRPPASSATSTTAASRDSRRNSVPLSPPPPPPTEPLAAAFDTPAYPDFSTGRMSPSENTDFLGFMSMEQPNSVTGGSGEATQSGMFVPTFEEEIPVDPFLTMLDQNTQPMNDQWLVQADQGTASERPSTPVEEEVTIAYGKMSTFCHGIEPWQVYDPKTPLHYLVNRLKDLSTDIATKNATPFLHRQLYRQHAPPSILACFSTCVLYKNRNPENASMVIRALHATVKELVEGEACRTVVTPVEKLARTQALFLYQIIRMLDGDVILRAQGERDVPLLFKWVGELCRLRENLGDLAQLEDGIVRKQPPQEWERWIFAESVRRTIVMAQSFLKLYEMMNSSDMNDPEPDFWFHAHRWTLSRHLWEADTSAKFTRMWRERPHFIVTNYSFQNFLKYGRGDDVDEFAEILLIVYMGVDETKELLASRHA